MFIQFQLPFLKGIVHSQIIILPLPHVVLKFVSIYLF